MRDAAAGDCSRGGSKPAVERAVCDQSGKRPLVVIEMNRACRVVLRWPAKATGFRLPRCASSRSEMALDEILKTSPKRPGLL